MVNFKLLFLFWLGLINLVSASSFKNDHHVLGNADLARSMTENIISQNLTDSPLLKAVKSGDNAKVKMLLDAGYDPNHQLDSMAPMTPIFFAPNKQIAKLLLKAGADLNVKDLDGRTALFHIKDRDTLKYIIEQGADVNNVDAATGETLLHSVDDGEIARLLLEKGADVNARESYGHTPLHTKIITADVSQVLIDYGADLNAINDAKSTPLDTALSVQGQNPAKIKTLVDSGAYF